MLIDTSIDSVSTLSKVEWVDTHAHLNPEGENFVFPTGQVLMLLC